MEIPAYISPIISELNTHPMPTVVMSVGLPGSGKLTLLKELGSIIDSSVIDVDTEYKNLQQTRRHGFSLRLLDAVVAEKVSQSLAGGNVTLVHNTLCSKASREHAIQQYRRLGAHTLGAVWLETTVDLAISRDARRRDPVGPAVIERLNASLVQYPPHKRDGFDWIQKIISD